MIRFIGGRYELRGDRLENSASGLNQFRKYSGKI